MPEEDFLEQEMPEPKPSMKPTLQSPQTLKKAAAAALPKFAQTPWPQAPLPQGGPPTLAPTDEVKQQIKETHGGVQRLQSLLEPVAMVEEKNKLDTIIDLLETVVGILRTHNERQDWILQRLTLVMRALEIRIPIPDQET